MLLTKSPKDEQCDGETGQILYNMVQEEVGGNVHYNDKDKWRRDVYIIFHVRVTYTDVMYLSFGPRFVKYEILLHTNIS